MRRLALFLLAVLIAGSSAFIHTAASPQLPGALFLTVILVFLASMLAWTIALYVRFRNVD